MLASFGGAFGLYSIIYFSWKQELSKKKSLVSSARIDNPGIMTEQVARPERGLPPAEQQSYLQKLRTTSIVDWNLKRLTQIMFEETYVAAIFALFAILLESLLQPLMKEHAGSPWLVAIPIGFFVFLCLVRPFETYLLWMVYPTRMNTDSLVQRGGTAIRLQRVLENLVLIGILILIQAAPPTLLNTRSDALIELELKNNLEWGSSHYLLYLLSLARKFHGSCAMVVLYRIYIDLAIQTSTFAVGYPSGAASPSEAEEDKQEFDNGNEEEANANYSYVDHRWSNANISALPSRRRILIQSDD